jgi:hypothetical protein
MIRAVPMPTVAIYVAVSTIIAGLVVRGRWRLSVFFAAYNVAGLLLGLLQFFWPERFFTGTVWMPTQATLDILKLGIALEVAWRTFRAFPGAAWVARVAIVATLVVATTLAIVVPLAGAPASAYETALAQFHPRLLDATIWAIVMTLCAARWYRVPLHPFHGAVLTTLAVYLAFQATLFRLFSFYDFAVVYAWANAVDLLVFLLIASWWGYVSWRPDGRADREHVHTLQKLQPQALTGEGIA